MGFCPCFGRRGQKPEDHETSALATARSAIAFGSLDSLFVEPNQQYRVNGNHEAGTSGGGAIIQCPVRMFSYYELVVATNNFRQDLFLGQGGFGSVHKGWLDNGQVVAIKQLDRSGLQGSKEFLIEVVMLSVVHHEHLVNLVGFCPHGNSPMLVYEYMPLGSLEDHLHEVRPDRPALDWKTRMKIVAGAAKGLEHLHDKLNPPIIYRDFKPSNILLGEGYFPKLSDFGLARYGPDEGKSHVTTRVMGTQGYCAPEYAATGKLTVKSDIYSFGVVILETITGRRGYDPNMPSQEQYVVDWARPMFKDSKNFPKMADRTLKGKFPRRGLIQALAIAALCVHENPAKRPTISEVASALSFLASQPDVSNDNYGGPSTPESLQKHPVEDRYSQEDAIFRVPHRGL